MTWITAIADRISANRLVALKLAVFLLFSCILISGISYLYHLEIALIPALAGMFALWIIKYLLARWLGFSLWSAVSIVTASAAIYVIYCITSGNPTIVICGSELGVPDSIINMLGNMDSQLIETVTIPIFIFLVFSLGWKYGWLSIVLLWAYTVAIPEPVSMIFANAFSDTPSHHNLWMQSAINHMPWNYLIDLAGFLAIGMMGFFSGKWYKRRFPGEKTQTD